MPELPEVESLGREIAAHLSLDHEVAQIVCHRANLRFPFPQKKFASLVGQKIVGVTRRAKYLIFDFGQMAMISHLGMTGGWRFGRQPAERTHDHFAIHFKNSEYLIFNDPRRFGYIDILEKKNLAESVWFQHLGPEPFDKTVTAASLMDSAKKSKRPIKVWLMDQKNIVGVGNIYASESLYTAKIHPLKAAGLLNIKNWEVLLQSIRKILKQSIQAGGTTLRDYRSLTGDSGAFQSHLHVYGRTGQLCGRCETKIKEIFLVGRSTFWCPGCQTRAK